MTVDHPAQYSTEVLELVRYMIPRGTRVHDPFAGAGVRLAREAADRGWLFTGTELEREFIGTDLVVVGNACEFDTYPTDPFVILTSPVYPNGMADDWDAQDDSTRRTYRKALGRPLHHDNQGQYGYRGQPAWSSNRMAYWDVAKRAAECWTLSPAVGLFVNVSDFMSKQDREPVVNEWAYLLTTLGWTGKCHEVKTRRYRNGANRDARVETEAVLVAHRVGAQPVASSPLRIVR